MNALTSAETSLVAGLRERDDSQARATRCAPEVGEPLAKGEVFESQLRSGAEGGA